MSGLSRPKQYFNSGAVFKTCAWLTYNCLCILRKIFLTLKKCQFTFNYRQCASLIICLFVSPGPNCYVNASRTQVIPGGEPVWVDSCTKCRCHDGQDAGYWEGNRLATCSHVRNCQPDEGKNWGKRSKIRSSVILIYTMDDKTQQIFKSNLWNKARRLSSL